MMTHIEAFILGLVQGLTEFLPVSSSGHTAILQKFFGINADNISITIVAHLGSLMAILFYYRHEFIKILKDLFKSRTSILVNPTIRLICLVVVATIPAAIVGIGFRSTFDALFQSTSWIGSFFLFTSVVLFISQLKSTDNHSMTTNTEHISHEITYTQAFLIGLSQAVAICPGISRAGMTITTGLFVGLKKQNAAFFSFLISVPAILGATILDLKHISEMQASGSLITLFFSSLVFGFVGLFGVIFVLQRGKLHYFSYYLFPLGIFVLMYFK